MENIDVLYQHLYQDSFRLRGETRIRSEISTSNASLLSMAVFDASSRTCFPASNDRRGKENRFRNPTAPTKRIAASNTSRTVHTGVPVRESHPSDDPARHSKLTSGELVVAYPQTLPTLSRYGTGAPKPAGTWSKYSVPRILASQKRMVCTPGPANGSGVNKLNSVLKKV